MKKTFIAILALVIVFSLATCGRETNNSSEPSKSSEAEILVDVITQQGISLKLPRDMTLQTIEGNTTYVNTKTGEVASFVVAEVDKTPLSGWNQENVLATYQSKYKDVVVKSFENGKKINGKEALVSKVTLKTPKGNDFTIVLVMLTDGKKNYIVTLGYGSDNTEGSLAKNIQASIDSITIKNP